MILDRALAYVELGWAVFPLVPNTKRPLTKNGFKDASKSVYLVKKWWTDNPDANIGIATGQVSGIVVVDLDVKNDAKGMESYQTLSGMSPTLMAETPSGGWHFYYAAAGPLRCRNGLLPGIDIKADGGYVVAPGSLIDGKPYEWLDPEAHSVTLPDTITTLMAKGNSARPAPASADDEVIPEGLRKEQIAELLADTLGWTNQEKSSWVNTYTSMKFDEVEGVYFPDTYLIPVDEPTAEVAKEMLIGIKKYFILSRVAGNAKVFANQLGLIAAAAIIRQDATQPGMNNGIDRKIIRV